MATSRYPMTLLFRLLALCLFLAAANCQTSTTLVTATTTVTASETNGPCDNFNGACVVYGGAGGAPYTTTVYNAGPPPPPPPTVVTATTTTTVTYIPASEATTGASSACQNFNGACVVYGTNAQGSARYTTTIFAGSSSNDHNGNGEIGAQGNSGGYIGSGASLSLSMPVLLSLASLLLVNLGFLVWM